MQTQNPLDAEHAIQSVVKGRDGSRVARCSCGLLVLEFNVDPDVEGVSASSVRSQHEAAERRRQVIAGSAHRGPGLLSLAAYALLVIFLVAVAVEAFAHGALLGVLVALGFAVAFLGGVFGIARSRS